MVAKACEQWLNGASHDDLPTAFLAGQPQSSPARPVASLTEAGRSSANSGLERFVPRSRSTSSRAAAAAILATALLMGACAAPRPAENVGPVARITIPEPRKPTVVPAPDIDPIPAAQIITGPTPLECVPYARQVAGVSIRGNAWTWWRSAERHYGRDRRPALGSILVFKRTSRLPYGHVAVVSRVLNGREILAEHANWLNRGRIHSNTLVRDVSSGNDWSAVRVWYTPGNTLGKRTYAAYGFIHPHQARALRLRQPRMQGADVRALQQMLADKGFAVAVDGIFGPDTRDALVAYQGRNGLARDGIAGPRTRANLGI